MKLVGDLLIDALMERVRATPGWIAERFGHAFLQAAVEWVAGVDPLVDIRGPSDYGPAAAARLETVRWRGHDRRVPPLDLMFAINERRGRADRATLIRNAMTQRDGG